MLYCFLAGIAVSHSKLLWVMPVASAAYLLLLSAILLSLDCWPFLQSTIRCVVHAMPGEGLIWSLSADFWQSFTVVVNPWQSSQQIYIFRRDFSGVESLLSILNVYTEKHGCQLSNGRVEKGTVCQRTCQEAPAQEWIPIRSSMDKPAGDCRLEQGFGSAWIQSTFYTAAQSF